MHLVQLAERYIMNFIPEKEYNELHNQNLVPLNININVDDFLSDIKEYDSFFKQWGDKFTDLSRYGLPLVNKNGRLDNEPEPACWPLDRWNFVNLGYNDTPEDFTKFYKDIQNNINTDKLELEMDFTEPTSALNMKSLEPLNEIKKYMVRSCILKWNTKAHFKPHYDTWHPVRWLRLWGTTNPDGVYVRFKADNTDDGFCMWNDITKKHEIYKAEERIEPGRLYIINTLKWHDALAFKDDVYHFFIALNVDSYETLTKLKL